MKKIVTGGAGFIGLNLVELLCQEPDPILVIDNFSEGSDLQALLQIMHRYPQLNFIQRDIRDKTTFDILIDEECEMYHLAAQSHVDRSISNPVLFLESNAIGTANVLEAARARPKMRLLVVSTDEVYGDEGPFPTPWGAPIRTSSPYSASKAAADLFVEAYRRTYKIPVKLSRCCNNFGKYQNGEKFIPTVIRSILQEKPVPIYGNGQQMRQWVPAKEHARRLIQLMRDDSAHNTHVGGYSLKNLDLVNLISTITEKKHGKKAVIQHVTDRPGHDVKYELMDDLSIDEAQFKLALEEYITNFDGRS